MKTRVKKTERKVMLVTFTKDKETKNTVRFTSAIGNEVSGSIYVQKGSELAQETEIVLEILVKHPAELQETA